MSTVTPHRPSRLALCGRWLIYLGIALIVAALVLGFGALSLGWGRDAIPFLSLAPLGILLCFAGLVGVLLGNPEEHRPDPD
ncbi:MAG TPA: hypothetical protein VNN09_00550 [Candidatus Competibacteraceae bacterium]|nr:hypothetical protein [Candidatus Competibacteraceae bacterium]